jgi:NitT/TauT family transport system ATP-binding protein
MSAQSNPTGELADLIPICARLPLINVDQLVGATKILANANGRMSRREFALAFSYGGEHVVGATEFLAGVEVIDGEVALTAIGTRIAHAGIDTRKRLFSEVALYLPIVRKISDTLESQPSRSLPRSRLLNDLGAAACAADADRLFDHLLAWGRYADLFSYDPANGMVTLFAGA